MHVQFVNSKLVILLLVWVCSWFVSTGVFANANLIVITPKEQSGAESIVYSSGTVIGAVLLQNLFLKTRLLQNWPSLPLGTLLSPSLMTNFSGTRSMKFHQSIWYFRYQTNGIPLIWLIFQVPDQWNSINLVVEILKHSAPLHFEYELRWTAFLTFGTPQQWISRKKTRKNNFQKIIFPYLKTDAFWKITHMLWNFSHLLPNHSNENLPHMSKYFSTNFVYFSLTLPF